MPAEVTLVGFDFGSTTSSAVVASAELTRNAVTGRTELSHVREKLRSPLEMTPLAGERLDEPALAALIDRWLAQGDVRHNQVFGGGALVTGLAARRDNAANIVRLVRARLRNALVATADDPCLESWLAFQGSCANLSLAQPETPFVNLDIGGGTTNLALGRGGQVLRTGCLLVGARHVQVEPGGYRIKSLSQFVQQIFAHLGIKTGVGQQLSSPDLAALLDYYLQLLQTELTAPGNRPAEPLADQLRQVPFRLPDDIGNFAITLSGGVGELVYAHLRGQPWPSTTAFGDLGIDLARRLVESAWWSPHLRRHVPTSAGRATVYGLLRHNTEISGNTLFLPRPEQLPLPELPILGTIRPQSTADDLNQLLSFARRSAAARRCASSCRRPTWPRYDRWASVWPTRSGPSLSRPSNL